MKISSLLQLSLFVCLVAQTVFAQGAPKAAPPLRVDSNEFSIMRPLGYYANRLSNDFAADLAKLGPEGHWIDGGSAEGVAVEHYYQLGKNAVATQYASPAAEKSFQRIAETKQESRAYVTGITYHMLRTNRPTYGDRLRHLSGRLMEDIPAAEIGRADLISDVYGVYAYSNRFDQALAAYLRALKRNGKIYVFHDSRMYETTIRVGDRVVPIYDWLNGIRGLRVERLGAMTVRITKTGGDIEIPRLRFISENEQAPPVRVFQQVEGTIRVADVEDGVGPQVDFTRPTGPHVPPRVPRITAEQIRFLNQLLGYHPMLAD